ncbi:GNAT family N-acetyltransferase [uncultured Cohaesibacter sp.]|uniref:GNAT family N-acetyltransferase n=1 Tax=uncultured Cohaesibacter sp. TaxID=1002546 RepID=UPI0029C75975|nr:GNAT family N-acetyltransferase [uncultured Cohaesibacter sp.]
MIRPYEPQDKLGIRDLIVPIQRGEFGLDITYDDQPDLKDIPARYQVGHGEFWVAVEGDMVVGTIALEDIGENILALRKVFVHADYRGSSGLAQRLLATAIDHARSKGIGWIYLGTTDRMQRAHRFYERSGFEAVNKPDLPPNFTFPKVDSVFYRLAI